MEKQDRPWIQLEIGTRSINLIPLPHLWETIHCQHIIHDECGHVVACDEKHKLTGAVATFAYNPENDDLPDDISEPDWAEGYEQ